MRWRAGASVADQVDQLGPIDGTTPTFATDDWPFLYLRTPGIPVYYLAALAVLLGFAVVAVALASRVTRMPLRRGFSPHFFVLGIAFLLLETRSLVTFSLLFGTTWSVNALVFFAVLLSVLVAIGISARFKVRRPALLYLGLFGTLALAWLLPPEQLLIDPPALRYALAAALAFAPIFFANLVFAHSFRETDAADMAFASNLLGAMVGGALEYVALLTGLPGAAHRRGGAVRPGVPLRHPMAKACRPRVAGGVRGTIHGSGRGADRVRAADRVDILGRRWPTCSSPPTPMTSHCRAAA